MSSTTQVPLDEYVYVATQTLTLPFSVADCGALKREIVHMEDELARVKASFSSSGSELMERIKGRRSALLGAISQTRAAIQASQTDEAVAAATLGLSIVLLGFGVAFASPLALGTLAAVQIGSGPLLLSWQLYK